MDNTTYVSPNFNDRRAEVDMLVLHYTGMMSARVAFDRLCDPKAEVSAHYVIDEDGSVYQLVDEANRAWHAGVGLWQGEGDVNSRSVGIEMVNPGHEFGYREFPEVQTQACAQLCQDIILRHKIPAHNVVAHADIAPTRKEDPGELFDWQFLSTKGVGLWGGVHEPGAELLRKDAVGEQVKKLQDQLCDYGYDIFPDGSFGGETHAVVVAFQRHFIQRRFDGVWDEGCQAVLDRLFAQL